MKQFKNKGNCRGDGKLYMLFSAEEHVFYDVAARTSDGRELPSHFIALNETEFVIILADFTINQEIVFLDENSQVIEKQTIIPQIVAFESKANGLLHKELCARIRNIDKSGINSLSSITFQRLIPCTDGFIVRGVVTASSNFSTNGIIALNEEGARVGEGVFLNRNTSLLNTEIASFSITINEPVRCLCLSIVGENGKMNSFVNYKNDLFGNLCSNSNALYNNAYQDGRYQEWLSDHRITDSDATAQAAYKFQHPPIFSVIVPLYKTPLNFFVDMTESVVAQTYRNWELILVNSTPEEAELHDKVVEYANSDSRIRYVDLDRNHGITENTNKGIQLSKGDYLCFFDHDDVLEPNILFEYASAIEANPLIDLLYCDEDKLLPNGALANPSFKPDFSLDMARDNNYICHLLTVKKCLLDKIAPSDKSLDGAQDHAMVLKIAELGGRIHHVPKVLYHWRISDSSTAGNPDSKPYATVAGIKAVQEHLDRIGLPGEVSCSHDRAFRYSPNYKVNAMTTCSLIVATRGGSQKIIDFLEALNKTQFDNIEIIFLCSATQVGSISNIAAEYRYPFKCIAAETEFNLASWRNIGANAASGDVFVFVHEDISPANSSWLNTLAGFALRKDVGVVGTMTCDADGVIQQAGYSFVGDSIVALSKGIHCSSPGYLFFPLTVRDVAAISGVCLAVSRSDFYKLGGFDESFQLDYSDIDFCFKANSNGLKVIYTPEAQLFHDGHIEAGLKYNKRSHRHFEDKALLLMKWSEKFSNGDQWFSPHFSRNPREAELYKLGGLDQSFS